MTEQRDLIKKRNRALFAAVMSFLAVAFSLVAFFLSGSSVSLLVAILCGVGCFGSWQQMTNANTSLLYPDRPKPRTLEGFWGMNSKVPPSVLVCLGVFQIVVGGYIIWVVAPAARATYEISSTGGVVWVAFMGVLALIMIAQGCMKLKDSRTPPQEVEESDIRRSAVEDRLDELERLKRRNMVTPEEYAAKRQEILKDL